MIQEESAAFAYGIGRSGCLDDNEDETKLLRVLYVAIGLMVANVAVTSYLAFTVMGLSHRAASGASNNAIQVPKDKAQALAATLVEPYNRGDSAAIYGLFDPLARIQFSQEKMAETIAKLKPMVGRIDEYVYSHAESAGKQDGREFITLNYRLRLSGGQLPAGTMKITVNQERDRLNVFGFYINVNQQ